MINPGSVFFGPGGTTLVEMRPNGAQKFGDYSILGRATNLKSNISE